MGKTLLLIACNVCFLGLFASTARAETHPKEIKAVRAATPPRIDGDLGDQAWMNAPSFSDFTQYDPDEGAPPTETTEVRVLYDGSAVYFYAKLHDSEPDRIVAQLTRRDRSVESDRFTIQIDSYHDRQTAFVFVLYASGVQRDGLLLQDGLRFDEQWDAVWESAVRRTSEGWNAEFKVPFSALRFSKYSVQQWGINFRRYISRKRETDEWVMVPRREASISGYISKSGLLVGIENIDFPKYLEFLPYVLSKSQELNIPPGTGDREFIGNVGADFKADFGRNFAVNLTLNPDFGQVEVDEAVLNLTAFETFYPEKRPFFLEGTQIFDFGTGFDGTRHLLFYSRRIGRRPSGFFSLPPNGRLVEPPPTFTTVLGAAKLTGRTQSGLSVGILSGLTDVEDAILEDSNGRNSRQVVEPLANYTVARVKKDFWKNSFVGMMATSTLRRGRLPVYASGLDWNFRFSENTYGIDGNTSISRSALTNSGHQDGSSGRVLMGKISGRHWLYQATYEFTSKQYDIDDLGFFIRGNKHGGYAQATYKEDRPVRPLLRYAVRVAMDNFWNFDGFRIGESAEINPYFEFRNFWSLNLSYQYDWSIIDDFETRGNGLYRRQAAHSVRAAVNTDFRKTVAFGLTLRGVRGLKEYRRGEVSLTGKIRLTTWVEFEPVASATFVKDEEAWVIPSGGGFNNFVDPSVSSVPLSVFGNRDTDQFNFSMRGTMTFTKDLSLQLFLQVFLARGHYDDYRRLVDAKTLAPYNYAGTPYYGNPDFNSKTVNANIVLRWEYLPGSTLFLVWTHERFGVDGDFYNKLGSDIRSAFKQPMNNLFLLKVSYWWSL